MVNIEIWASGGGTNADVIASFFADHKSIRVRSIASNRKDAGVFKVAKKHNIRSYYWSKEQWSPQEILRQLREREIDFVVLAGFLKLVPQEVVSAYENKMVNIHPSLLPKYGGKNYYGDNVHNSVLENKEDYSGITIHVVNSEFDKGKILAQYTTIIKSESLADLKKQIQSLEHTHFTPTIESYVRTLF